MADRAISPELHAEYSPQLEQLLDEKDELELKKSEIGKALGGEIKIVARQIARVRRVLKGTENPQEEIPGTEVGERRRDPIVARVLRAAAGLAEQEEEDEKQDKKAKKSASKTAPVELVWHREGDNQVAEGAGGTYCVEHDADGFQVLWTETGGKSKPIGADIFLDIAKSRAAVHHEKRAGVKRTSPKEGVLEWIPGRGNGTQKAEVLGGLYQLASVMGLWRAEWLPFEGSKKVLVGGSGLPEQEAKKVCQDHHLDQLGDAKLRNAGAGELVQPSLSGPATAFKKGRRRG